MFYRFVRKIKDGKWYMVSDFGEVRLNVNKILPTKNFIIYIENNLTLEYLEQWFNPLVKIYSDLTIAYPEMDKWIDHETLVSRAYRIYTENPEKYGSPKIGCDMLSRDIISEYEKDWKYYGTTERLNQVLHTIGDVYEVDIEEMFVNSLLVFKKGNNEKLAAKTCTYNLLKMNEYVASNFVPSRINSIRVDTSLVYSLCAVARDFPNEKIEDADALWCFFRNELENVTPEEYGDAQLSNYMSDKIKNVLKNERK